MWYLMHQFSLPLFCVLGLGFLVGWITCARATTRWLDGWTALALGLLAFGLVLAVTKMVGGRAGLWLDTALLFAATYLVGCGLGCLLRGLFAAPGETDDPVGTMPIAAMPVAVGVGRVSAVPLAAMPAPAPIASTAREASVQGAMPGAAPVTAAPVLPTPARQAPAPYPAPAVAPAAAASLGVPDQPATIVTTPPPPTLAATIAALPPQAPSVAAALASSAGAIASAAAMKQGSQPAGLAAARDNAPDDLKRIRGIGRQNEGRLHGLGIWHFDQIASWTADEAKWVGGYLAFPGRIEREDWIAQARVLATGADTAFSVRVARGEVATSADLGDGGRDNIEKPVRRET